MLGTSYEVSMRRGSGGPGWGNLSVQRNWKLCQSCRIVVHVAAASVGLEVDGTLVTVEEVGEALPGR
jgi:hypothetical protein